MILGDGGKADRNQPGKKLTASSVLHARFDFRSIHPEEAAQTAELETICFPPNEACTEEMLLQRVRKAPEMMLIAADRSNGRMVGFLSGLATEEEKFRDEFFSNAELHKPDGKQVMLLGLNVLPEYRRQGIARELMLLYCCRAREEQRKALILTCLEDKVGMYRKMGFSDRGISASGWGGEQWHEMYCLLGQG